MGATQTPTAKLVIAAGICLLVSVLAIHFTAFRPDKTIIRLHDDQIDIQKMTNAIARFIIEKGYGYKVQLVESTIKEVHERLTRGDIDITLEMWKDNNLAWYDIASEKGDVIDLGPIYTGGRQYWIIPRWYAREKNIRTVFDMTRHWRDFVNPEDPSKGIFFNCIFGWSCRDINKVKLAAYGLDRYYNTVSPTSPEALESIYENARMRELPVFGYYWEPNALIARQDWYALEEPPYDERTWEKIIEAANDPDAPQPEKACAFKEIGVHKLAHRQLMDKAPDAAQMLSKMTLDTKIFTDILFSHTRKNIRPEEFEQMAVSFLTAYPDQWTAWVNEDTAKKIKAALSSSPYAMEKKEN